MSGTLLYRNKLFAYQNKKSIDVFGVILHGSAVLLVEPFFNPRPAIVKLAIAARARGLPHIVSIVVKL